MKPTRSLGSFFLLALCACLAAPSTARADQVVYFQNGKAIMVKKVEKGEKVTILEMEGGGKMGVPTAQILKIEEYEISQPNGQVAAAPPAPAVTKITPTTTAVPTAPAQPPPVASAPVVAQPAVGQRAAAAVDRDQGMGIMAPPVQPGAPRIPGPGAQLQGRAAFRGPGLANQGAGYGARAGMLGGRGPGGRLLPVYRTPGQAAPGGPIPPATQAPPTVKPAPPAEPDPPAADEDDSWDDGSSDDVPTVPDDGSSEEK